MPKWKLPDFTRDDSYETQETLDPRSQDARRWRGHRGFLRSPSCHRSAEPGDLETEKDHVIWCFEMLMFKRKWPDQYDEANYVAKRQKGFFVTKKRSFCVFTAASAWLRGFQAGCMVRRNLLSRPPLRTTWNTWLLLHLFELTNSVMLSSNWKIIYFFGIYLYPVICTASLTALFSRPAGRTIIADGRKS